MAYGYNPRPVDYGFIADLGSQARSSVRSVATEVENRNAEIAKAKEAAKKLRGNRRELHNRYMQLHRAAVTDLVQAGYKEDEAKRVFRTNLPPPTGYHYEHPEELPPVWTKGLEKLTEAAETKRQQMQAQQQRQNVSEFARDANTPRVPDLSPRQYDQRRDARLGADIEGPVQIPAERPSAASLEQRAYDLSPEARKQVQPIVDRRFQEEAVAREQKMRRQQVTDLQQNPPQTQYEGYMQLEQPEKAVESLPKNLLEVDETTERINKHERSRMNAGVNSSELHDQRKDVAMELGRAEDNLAANRKLQKDLKRVIDKLGGGQALSGEMIQALGEQGIAANGDAEMYRDMLARVRVAEGEAQQNVRKAQQMLKEMNADPTLGSRQAARLAEEAVTGESQRMMAELAQEVEARNLGPGDADRLKSFTWVQKYPPDVVQEFIRRWSAGDTNFAASAPSSYGGSGGGNVAPGRQFNLRTAGGGSADTGGGIGKRYKILSVE